MKCLIIAAHPDDEVLGCGGTVLKLKRNGAKAVVSIFGEGVTSRHAKRDEASPEQISEIKQQARHASRILGVDDITFIDLPDNMFDTVPLLTVVKYCEDLIRLYSPDMVITHSLADLNIDHHILARAVLTAVRPCTDAVVRDLLAFEIPSSTEWSFGQLNGGFNPNVFVDISAHIDKKIEAFLCYRSEVRNYPHPRSAEALRIIAQRWGTVCGCGAAEAFQVIRALR